MSDLKLTNYIIDIKRTAIGKYQGTLKNIDAINLIIPIFNYFIKKYPFLKNHTDEIIIGNVLSAGLGQNPARIASFKAGIANKTPSFTVNHVCGSGMTSIIQGIKSIILQNADIALAGGMESMSNAPYLLNNHRVGRKFGNDKLVDSIFQDGLYCSLTNSIMGKTAENIAKKYKITRKDQDKFAFNSHAKAITAIDKGYFNNEIIDLISNIKGKTAIFNKDESPRRDTSIEKLEKLNSIFKNKGTVTAGNSSGINDGAALCLLTSENAIKKYNIKPMAKIIAYDYIGLSPIYMGLGSYYSISRIIKKSKININNIDLFEINEAFASQVLAVIKLLKIEKQKVNINGGAIALGHPLGASGTRILATLVYNLKRTGSRYGIASLCIGGGQGVSVLVEKI